MDTTLRGVCGAFFFASAASGSDFSGPGHGKVSGLTTSYQSKTDQWLKEKNMSGF